MLIQLCWIVSLVILCLVFVRTHPLDFNESFWGHCHCIKAGGISLIIYSREHGGSFPFHTNGFGDALVLVNDGSDAALTGPGYTTEVFDRARRTGENAPESEFGRVYVQGLSESSESELALLFDKVPTPGGDHCHGFQRLSAPLGREVFTVGGEMKFIPESDWPKFATEQVTLLVAEGIPRWQAEEYFFEKTKNDSVRPTVLFTPNRFGPRVRLHGSGKPATP